MRKRGKEYILKHIFQMVENQSIEVIDKKRSNGRENDIIYGVEKKIREYVLWRTEQIVMIHN